MKVIVKVNNERGRAALLWHRKEEDEFRAKTLRVPKWLRNKAAKKFLKTKSVMYEDREVITGFKNYTEKDKEFFIKSVASAMKTNGAEPDDYEVLFTNDDRTE